MKSVRLPIWIARSDRMWNVPKIRFDRTLVVPKSSRFWKSPRFVDFDGNVWPACGRVPDNVK